MKDLWVWEIKFKVIYLLNYRITVNICSGKKTLNLIRLQNLKIKSPSQIINLQQWRIQIKMLHLGFGLRSLGFFLFLPLEFTLVFGPSLILQFLYFLLTTMKYHTMFLLILLTPVLHIAIWMLQLSAKFLQAFIRQPKFAQHKLQLYPYFFLG